MPTTIYPPSLHDALPISKNAQPGEMISPMSAGGSFTRTGICTIVDMDSLEIEVDVNESYINRVEPGQPVEAKLDAYPDWVIPRSEEHTSELQSLTNLVCRPRSTPLPYTTLFRSPRMRSREK